MYRIWTWWFCLLGRGCSGTPTTKELAAPTADRCDTCGAHRTGGAGPQAGRPCHFCWQKPGRP
jgi:hypothetical protein